MPAIAVLLVGSVFPHPRTLDVRKYVSLQAERVADPNPLAVAARWGQIPADKAATELA